jgi:hypothetical protein
MSVSGSVFSALGESMKTYLAIALGLALLLAPLWSLSGFVTVPEFRSGTVADYSSALIASATLYGGVLVGVLVSRPFKSRHKPVGFRTTFTAGMAGAMGAITLALFVTFVSELITTGRLMPVGHTPALLPMFYVVGGMLSAIMAAGAGLILYGLSGGAKR